MATGTPLLNDDGSASMATMIMLSHHAFRRDLARLRAAVERVASGDASHVEALRGEWQSYHAALHGHHEIEDARMFPSMKAEHSELGAVIDGLTADHELIDPLLARGDAAFTALPVTDAAKVVLGELEALLDRHLQTEEANVIPLLRGANQFPPPPDDAAAEMYAAGFAWSLQGIARDVLVEVKKMLPESLLSRLPAAQKAFDERCVKVWGSAAAGAARTSIP